MALTNNALEQMGFRKLREDETLSASFSCTYTFEIQGISSKEGLLVTDVGIIEGVNYRVIVSNSLKVAAQNFPTENFCGNELVWEKEYKSTPPYLLVYLGPTAVHEMNGDFLKEEPFGIRTYDAFNSAREELQGMENEVLPRIISALSCIFGCLSNPVSFRELNREVIGKSLIGVTVLDFRMKVNAELQSAQPVSEENLSELIKRSTSLASQMDSKIAQFYHLALNEADPLKRFLYLFLTIERQTNATFKDADHRAEMLALVIAPDRIQQTAASFLGSQPARLNFLKDKFIWCALTVWSHLTDEDVTNFTRVKKIRDQIAHGEIDAPQSSDVVLVEKVAAKLQLGTPRA